MDEAGNILEFLVRILTLVTLAAGVYRLFVDARETRKARARLQQVASDNADAIHAVALRVEEVHLATNSILEAEREARKAETVALVARATVVAQETGKALGIAEEAGRHAATRDQKLA